MKIATAIVATAALAAATGSIAPAKAQDACTEMQVFLSISPNHREDVMDYIAPRLKEATGVDLVAEAIGSANMVERISAQMPQPRITIAHWDVAVGIAACDQGLCTPIDLSRAPNAQNLYDWAYTKTPEGETNILATNVIGVGLLYNAEEFEKNDIPPPTSWEDLSRPELKGRISITAPASTWGTAALVQWSKMQGGGESDIEAGFDKAKSLMDNMHTVHTWSSELSNLMQLGEVWMGTTGSNMAPALRAQGLPLRWVMPEEGGPLVGGGVSLVKGAPCEDAAYEYLNLYYSEDFQLQRIKNGGLASPLPAAWEALSDEDRQNMDLGPNDFDKLVNFDWREIAKHRPEWIERWQREMQ
ncbi:ABC transporter substrate-binding protein [Afifella pfennigii]|uniref:ABC transporter substrate-binding protein n=1 Tax=Afifella pfennigii TaxID=209897 RepID=UPI00047B4152|nr:extracellular solute-binding protein [Afifella pfennigii]